MWDTLNTLSFADNELWRLIAFFAIVLLFLALGKLARLLMVRTAQKRGGEKREWVAALLSAMGRATSVVAFALGLRLGVTVLYLGPLQQLFGTVSRVLNAAAIGFLCYCLVDMVDHYLLGLAERTTSKVDDVLAPLVGKSVRITIAALVVLNVAVVISGKDIMTIVASLGVGGLAIALAGQDTIKNFFGSLVILGDKPFEIGDRIVMDGHDGPVESVGFRSTKIRTLDGHLVTVPNSEMVNRTVQNIGRRPYIRRMANIAITYDTPPKKVERAIAIIKEILVNHEGMDPELPPHVFFNEFGDWSLNILALYWYHPPDYWKYMVFTERVNLDILTRFNAEGIEFAFPTQSVHLSGDSGAGSPGPEDTD